MSRTAEWLRDLSDPELQTLAAELENRAEHFSAQIRQQLNDELRRRRMPMVQGRRW